MCAYDGGVLVAAVVGIAVVALLPLGASASRVRAAPEGRFALDCRHEIVVQRTYPRRRPHCANRRCLERSGNRGSASRPTGRSSCSVAAAGSFSAEPTAAARASSPGRPSTPGTPPVDDAKDGLSFAYGYDGFAGLCDRRASAVPGIVFALRDGTRVREFDVGPARPTPTLARAFSLFGWRPDGPRLLYLEIDQRQGYCADPSSATTRCARHCSRSDVPAASRHCSNGRPRSHLHRGRRMERVSSSHKQGPREDCAVWLVSAGGKRRRKLYEPRFHNLGCR